VQRWLALAALQLGDARRDAALLPQRGAPANRALPRAALAAACILEQHGYPPAAAELREPGRPRPRAVPLPREGALGRRRALARSGLHGRKPVFRSPRQLAASYMDAYVDLSGRVTGYAWADLRGARRLRLAAVGAERLKVEKWLVDYRHHPLPMPEARYRRALARYNRFRARFPDPAVRPGYFDGRERGCDVLAPPERNRLCSQLAARLARRR